MYCCFSRAASDAATSHIFCDLTLKNIKKILSDAVLAVAGPEKIEDILDLCRKWRDGLAYETKGGVERKTTALRGEWGRRVPEARDKGQGGHRRSARVGVLGAIRRRQRLCQYS